jgi:hypothetical protein
MIDDGNERVRRRGEEVNVSMSTLGRLSRGAFAFGNCG